MARSTFKVLFYLKRQAEQNGKAPIMGRITINGTISQFSCKLSISPKLWDTKANKATGKSVVAQRINEKLENIKTNIGKQYQRICDRDSYVTAEKVKNAWLGFRDGYQLLLQTFDEYLNDFEKNRVGKDRKASTLENYRKQYRRLAAFLQYEYKVEDIPFRELKREFIEKYVVYLSTVRRMLPGTLPNAIKKLKLMSYTAFKNGWIASDPFAGFRVAGVSIATAVSCPNRNCKRSWTCKSPIIKRLSSKISSYSAASRVWPMPMYRNFPMMIFTRMNGAICGLSTIGQRRVRNSGSNSYL